jgi:hypothetical protein
MRGNYIQHSTMESKMANKTFNVSFDGYWREEKASGIPNKSGVYCVYACTHNVVNNTVSLHELLYIGESDKVCDRIRNHEMKTEWKSRVPPSEELCYSFAEVDLANRPRVEAALIFKHRPPFNVEYASRFPFETTQIISTGKVALLNTDFTVQPNA